MVNVKRSAMVRFSQQQMFDLVNDIKSYPQFLPGCVDSRLLEQAPEQVKASLKVKKGGFSKWFTTRNELTAPRCIIIHLVDGPFKQLTGKWNFEAMGEAACQVSLDMEFSFSSILMEKTFGMVFRQVAANMVNAFIERARVVYDE